MLAIKPREKRQNLRIFLREGLSYQIRGTNISGDAVMDNIGIGGIGIKARRFIAPHTRLNLRINILSRILTPIGRVVWSHLVPRSDRYCLGIEFLELDRPSRTYLSDYIKISARKVCF